MENADDDSFSVSGTDGVVVTLDVDQNFEAVLKTIFRKRFHQTTVEVQFLVISKFQS
jgi:hypothetical protein